MLLAASGASGTVIETVPVGNTDNLGDARYGGSYGAVDYAYNIGKYEVTAAQYCGFLNAVATTADPHGLYNSNMSSDSYGCQIQQTPSGGGFAYSVVAAYANRPVTHVSFWDACRFANWVHNGQPTAPQGPGTTEDGVYLLNGVTNPGNLSITRQPGWTWAICTEDEWYKAAYHKNDGNTGNYWDYPTATDAAPGRDMSEATNPGNNANYWGSPFPIDGGIYHLTVAGEFELSDSPYGTFDQGGNVWEWNESIPAPWYRGLRGGSSVYGVPFLHATDPYTIVPTGEENGVGFRLVQVPEPATLALLVLGAAAALRRRRRKN
jgi:formylglycine-generating enzyme required for sulfatase activity